MQLAVVEFARNVAGLKGAHSTEFNSKTPYPVIAMITEWTTAEGTTEKRSAGDDLGGTMRLGGQECRLISGTHAHEAYDRNAVVERHRHRYEFNNNYRQLLQDKGLVVAGTSADNRLVEIVELPGHPWFVGVQFHPSSPHARATVIRCSAATSWRRERDAKGRRYKNRRPPFNEQDVRVSREARLQGWSRWASGPRPIHGRGKDGGGRVTHGAVAEDAGSDQ